MGHDRLSSGKTALRCCRGEHLPSLARALSVCATVDAEVLYLKYVKLSGLILRLAKMS